MGDVSIPVRTLPAAVLVVDDSAVVRRLVCDAIATAPDLAVAGTAKDGATALERLALGLPDVVVLDIEMPVLDGLATLERIRARWPHLPVVMFSTLTHRGATATLEALARGATDYVAKPTSTGPEAAVAAVAEALVPVLRACAALRRPDRRTPPARPVATDPGTVASITPLIARRGAPPEALVVASSTGGPHALTEILPWLPAGLPVPVLVVQHMPPLFTRLLAERLDARSPLHVVEAVPGTPVEPGTVYLAPGGIHLAVRRTSDGAVVCMANDGPPERSCKPSADVLFRSAAETWGSGTLALVLTGMGHDGLAGCRHIHEAGGTVIVQDEASSVVWGMPGAVAREGLAAATVPLGELAPVLARALRRSAVACAR